jgi:tetratricopeptide (TPR) repeat protein
MTIRIAILCVLLAGSVERAEAQFSAEHSGTPRGMSGASGSSRSGGGGSDRMMRQAGRRSGSRIAAPKGNKKQKVRARNSTVSLADLSAPKKAQKAYEKGRRQMRQHENAKAKVSFEKAVELHPEYASAWYYLGRIYGSERRGNDAWQAYRNAVSADPKSWRAYTGLADLAAARRNWMQLAETSDKALKLMPLGNSRLYVQNAVAKYSLGDLEGAEHSAREALDRTWARPNPKAYQILGLVSAQRGRYATASSHLRRYLELAPNANDVTQVRKHLAYVEAQQRRLSGEEPEFVLHPSGMLVRNEAHKH